MLGDRPLLVILGLSRGGTNHLAQRVHSCEGVVGLTEAASRFIVPSRNPERQLLSRSAMEAAVLKPTKPLDSARIVSLNKVNYTVTAYPEAWVEFLRADAACRTVVLLRNPFMIHRSRTDYVERRKPQRVRWRDPAQLARELVELFAMAWRLPDAILATHEFGLRDQHVTLLRDRLDLRIGPDGAPTACHRCGGPIRARGRENRDGADWLFCPACQQYIEGEGDYNFLRREDAEAARTAESAAYDADLDRVLQGSIGADLTQYFGEGGHWDATAPAELRARIDAEADRWERVPLNDILYPY